MVIESYKLDQKNDLEIVIDADCMNCGSAYHHRLPFDLRCQLVNDGSPIRDLYGAMFVHCGKPMTLGAGGAGRDYAELTCNCGYRNDVYFQ
ncbi:hypothetical protein UM93_12680 [Psychromicrobium lacuslunae]|uniref:Uncharacterized protein n=2 Tax=Psychromicrobium lacuslunae TaxID=1618207 RepID=A0A0D4C0E7_9MICC|nr:hypothetical protein UM93_12680 [Psychromicrobium lacuslunae]